MYMYLNYFFQEESGVNCSPHARVSEQSTLKRSRNQIGIEENERSEQSTQMETESTGISSLSSRPSALYTGSELQTKLPLNSILCKNTSSHPFVIPVTSGPHEESSAKSVFYIPVTGQHGMLPPVLSPSSSANQETRNGIAVPVVFVEGTTSSSQPIGNVLYMYNDLLYIRQGCFARKYTTCKIHTKLHPGPE